MKRYFMGLAILALVCSNDVSWATGFNNPLSSMSVLYGFGGSHIGTDLDGTAGDDIFAVAAGKVVYYRSNATAYGGGGGEGCASVPGQVMFIRHQKADGSYFIAQYGHVQNVPANLQYAGFDFNGPTVSQGQYIGEIGVFDPCRDCGDRCDHLHFGIWNSNQLMPSSNWGYGAACYETPEGCWVDPMQFLANESPFSFACTYAGQTPKDANGYYNLHPGDTMTVWVDYTNSSSQGSPAWTNNGSDPDNYVELKSCYQDGSTPHNGWLYNSADWINSSRVTSMNQSSVGVGSTARFEFVIKVPSDATVGVHDDNYFRILHATGGYISDWAGVNFPVNVIEDPGPGSGNKADISTFYDYGGTSSRLHMYLSNGSSFDFTGKYGWWMSTNYNSSDVLASVSADVNGDGADDVVNMYNYSASRRLHVFLSTGSSFSWTGSTGWWISSSGYDPAKVVGMVSGYFNNDQYEDVAVLYAESGSRLILQVFYSTGSSFVKQDWWDSNGIMSYYRDNIYGFTSGDYDDNGVDDICIVYHMGYRSTGEGYLTRLHVFKSTGSSFTLSPSVGWWSSPDNYEAARVHGAVSGDFNDDGVDDVALVYYMGFRSGGAGHLTRLHFFRSTGSAFAYYQIWWNSPENYEADKILHVASGDFTGDGTPDVCMMYDSTGVRLHVFRCTGSSFVMSGGYDGWWMNAGYNPSRELFMVSGHFNTGASAKLADESPPEVLPSQFALNQNYPNPFNPATTISYSLPSAMHVRLDIFNILGQRVQTLVDEHQSAGEHTVLWDSRNHASGIYLYRLQTAEAVETKKMVLLK